MSLREWINDHTRSVTIGTLVLLLAALAVVLNQFGLVGGFGVSDQSDPAYFWDLQTNKTFVVDQHQDPPIEAPSGGEGVRAVLFTCGDCTPDQWFGYLEKFSDQPPDVRGQGTEALPSAPEPGSAELTYHLIRPIEGDQWVPFTSASGEQIREYIRQRCGGTSAERCRP